MDHTFTQLVIFIFGWLLFVAIASELFCLDEADAVLVFTGGAAAAAMAIALSIP